MRYFEDLEIGQTLDLGEVAVTAEEIVEFARAWDPQPMHLDGGSGERLYEGLIASGWHTCCIWMRQICDHFLLDFRSMGSPGVDELRWTRPVRAGDTLRMTGTVLDLRPSMTRPQVGIARLRFDTANQDGETVMTMVNAIMFERRNKVGGSA